MPAQRLAITLGDPCSIGPEIGARAITEFLKETPAIELDIFGSASTWESNIFSSFIKDSRTHFHSEGESQAWVLGKPSRESGCLLYTSDAADE